MTTTTADKGELLPICQCGSQNVKRSKVVHDRFTCNDCHEWVRESQTSAVDSEPLCKDKAIGTAYETDTEIIIAVSHGYALSEDHNCDAMGCGMWHVLHRFTKTAPTPGAVEPLPTKQCWSSNNEEFNCDSLGELLDNMAADEIPKADDVVWVGEAVPPKFSELVEADMVIDGIADRAYDYASEYADNYPDVSKEEKAELQAMLERWLARVDTPRFYCVHKVKEYILTADDVAPYQEAKE